MVAASGAEAASSEQVKALDSLRGCAVAPDALQPFQVLDVILPLGLSQEAWTGRWTICAFG